MSTQDSEPPGPGQPNDTGEQGAKRVVRSLGTGVSCLFLLVVTPVLILMALAWFFDEPALSIAVIALVVAVAAYKSRRRGS